MSTFVSPGKLGDLVYGLAVMRDLGGGELYLQPDDTKGWLKFTQEHVDFLSPLLSIQGYVTGLHLHHGQTVTYDLGGFRKPEHWEAGMNLVNLHRKAVGLSPMNTHPAWLTAGELHTASQLLRALVFPVIINRTRRYRNPHFPWAQVYRKYQGDAAFVGTDLDHWEFEADFGPIPRIKHDNALSLAQCIADARLFIGSQSFPLALAIGLGQNVVHEISPWHPNCNFGRPNEWATGGGVVHLPELDELKPITT